MPWFQVIASSLKEEEIAGLHEIFDMMDTDKSGTITLQELKEGLKSIGASVSDEELQTIMSQVSNSVSLWVALHSSSPQKLSVVLQFMWQNTTINE